MESSPALKEKINQAPDGKGTLLGSLRNFVKSNLFKFMIATVPGLMGSGSGSCGGNTTNQAPPAPTCQNGDPAPNKDQGLCCKTGTRGPAPDNDPNKCAYDLTCYNLWELGFGTLGTCVQGNQIDKECAERVYYVMKGAVDHAVHSTPDALTKYDALLECVASGCRDSVIVATLDGKSYSRIGAVLTDCVKARLKGFCASDLDSCTTDGAKP